MSYPRFIEDEGWGLVANTQNAAIFQKDEFNSGEPKILISYADGTLLEIPRWLPNVNPAMGGLGQGRALDLEDGTIEKIDEFQAPEFYNQNVLMDLQNAIRIPIPTPIPQALGNKLADQYIWNTRQRVNPGRKKSEIDEEIDQILFEQRDYFGDISPGYILSSGYGIGVGQANDVRALWDGFPTSARATNARLWEMWHEDTGQFQDAEDSRRLRRMVSDKRLKAVEAAKSMFVQRQSGNPKDISIVEFRKWMKGNDPLWPITGADVLYIEDRLRERPGYNELLPLADNIKIMVGDMAYQDLVNFNNIASRNRALERRGQTRDISESRFNNSLHGTTKRNWDRIQLEGLLPAGERLSWDMIEMIGMSPMPQTAIDDFANGDENVIRKAYLHINDSDSAMDAVRNEDFIYMGSGQGFALPGDLSKLEKTVWATDDELVAAMFAESKYKTAYDPQGEFGSPGALVEKTMFAEGDYPVIIEIEDDDIDGSHFIVDPMPVMNTKGAEFRAFPFGVPASRLKLHKEFKPLPGETQIQFNKRLNDVIWQKWVDRPEVREYFKTKARTNGNMADRIVWKTPAPARTIEGVIWDRWDAPGTPLPNPMSKAKARSVANNIRNQKAGGGVHLARVIPVKGGYLVYERPKDRRWRGSPYIKRSRTNTNASGNLYLKKNRNKKNRMRKLSRSGGF